MPYIDLSATEPGVKDFVEREVKRRRVDMAVRRIMRPVQKQQHQQLQPKQQQLHQHRQQKQQQQQMQHEEQQIEYEKLIERRLNEQKMIERGLDHQRIKTFDVRVPRQTSSLRIVDPRIVDMNQHHARWNRDRRPSRYGPMDGSVFYLNYVPHVQTVDGFRPMMVLPSSAYKRLLPHHNALMY